MNKYQLYTLGGALLAATSLSGTASASSVGSFSGAAGNNFGGAVKVANSIFSPTAATANGQTIGGGTTANFGAYFGNSYNSGFNLYVTLAATGASFVTVPNPTARYLVTEPQRSNSIVATLSAGTLTVGTAPTVSALANQIFISNVNISFSGGSISPTNGSAILTGSALLVGVVLEGVTFTNLAGLATAGGSISLGATVASQSNQAQIYETVASGAIITSQAPVSSTVSAGTAGVVNSSTSPTQYTSFSSGGGGTTLSLTLATINITSTGAVGSDLSVPLSADGAGSTEGVTTQLSVVISGETALSDPAAVAFALTNNTVQLGATYTPGTSTTASTFSGTSVTFSLTAGAASYSSSVAVKLMYSGTTAISAAAAGTASISFSYASNTFSSPAAASSATAAVTRGGLSTQIDWANSGTGSGTGFTSYIRIHNTGGTAANASIVVKRDTTDGSPITTLGTYTTATVPAGGTIQVGVPTIESALGITAPSGSYTLLVSGGFPGYIQHLSYNGSSLIDLDGFRSAGATTP